MQAHNSIMCGYFCIIFIDFMLKGKSLVDYTNFLSPDNYEKNDKIILKYCGKYRKFQKPKISYLLQKVLFFYCLQ